MNGRPGDERADMFVDLALKAHTQDLYAEVFCKHPSLLEFVSKLTGWGGNTMALRRTLLRNNVPGTKPIGVHYDQIFLRYGEDSIVTAWVPIGDIKLNGGVLIYLENSESTSAANMSQQSLMLYFKVTQSVKNWRTNLPKRPWPPVS